eukprot:COSAG06_NODE_3314_length_5520_cov_6.952038_1_plen_214_part_00
MLGFHTPAGFANRYPCLLLFRTAGSSLCSTATPGDDSTPAFGGKLPSSSLCELCGDTYAFVFLVQSFRLSICPEPALANDQMNLLPRVAEHTTEWRCKLAFGGANLEKGPSSSKHCCSAHRLSRAVVQKPKRVNKAQIEAISVLRIHSPELAPELDMPRHGRYGNRWRGLCVCEAHFPADVSFIREPLSLSLGKNRLFFSLCYIRKNKSPYEN